MADGLADRYQQAVMQTLHEQKKYDDLSTCPPSHQHQMQTGAEMYDCLHTAQQSFTHNLQDRYMITTCNYAPALSTYPGRAAVRRCDPAACLDGCARPLCPLLQPEQMPRKKLEKCSIQTSLLHHLDVEYAPPSNLESGKQAGVRSNAIWPSCGQVHMVAIVQW